MAIHRFENPSTMPPTRGYTHVVDTTSPCRTIYISGQLGMTADGKFAGAPGDFRAQATQCFENLKHALAAVGANFEHVVKVTNYLHRHGAPADLLRSARPLRRHQGAAGLDDDSNLQAGARRRAVRDRSDRGGAAEVTAEKPETQREGNMNVRKRNLTARRAVAFGAVGVALMLSLNAASAQDKTYTMKITLPTLNDPSYFFAKSYAAALEKDSGGRIKPEIYPASQLGAIPRQIEGTQFGAIQCAVIPPEFFVGVDERFELMAAPGLVDSMDHGQRLAADPEVKKLMLGLGADKGLHGVAMFMNAPSSVIAKNAIRHVTDFKGKKIRVLASKFQMVPIERLGATPVAMTLGDVVPAMQQGAIDGAVGGIVVWTPMHFQRRGEIRHRDWPAGGLRHRRDQQDLVRLAACRTCRNSSTATRRQARPQSDRPQTISSPSLARAGSMPAAN